MIELYISPTCPYCRKVIDFFNEYNIIYVKRDISEQKNRDELIVLGGKLQVPFMLDRDSGTSMYESDDIIDYAKNIINNKGLS